MRFYTFIFVLLVLLGLVLSQLNYSTAEETVFSVDEVVMDGGEYSTVFSTHEPALTYVCRVPDPDEMDPEQIDNYCRNMAYLHEFELGEFVDVLVDTNLENVYYYRYEIPALNYIPQ